MGQIVADLSERQTTSVDITLADMGSGMYKIGGSYIVENKNPDSLVLNSEVVKFQFWDSTTKVLTDAEGNEYYCKPNVSHSPSIFCGSFVPVNDALNMFPETSWQHGMINAAIADGKDKVVVCNNGFVDGTFEESDMTLDEYREQYYNEHASSRK